MSAPYMNTRQRTRNATPAVAPVATSAPATPTPTPSSSPASSFQFVSGHHTIDGILPRAESFSSLYSDDSSFSSASSSSSASAGPSAFFASNGTSRSSSMSSIDEEASVARHLYAGIGRNHETLQDAVETLAQLDHAQCTQFEDGSYRINFIPHEVLTSEEREAQELAKDQAGFMEEMLKIREQNAAEKRLQAEALKMGVKYIPWSGQQYMQQQKKSSGGREFWSEPSRQAQYDGPVVHAQQVQPWRGDGPMPLAGAPTEIIP